MAVAPLNLDQFRCRRLKELERIGTPAPRFNTRDMALAKVFARPLEFSKLGNANANFLQRLEPRCARQLVHQNDVGVECEKSRQRFEIPNEIPNFLRSG